MELKEGEVICPKCKGSGNQADWMHLPDYRVHMECCHCNGSGKLDWIENITGKKEKPFKIRTSYGITTTDFHPGNVVGIIGS
jgi:DnaJ-class molecular chaperone